MSQPLSEYLESVGFSQYLEVLQDAGLDTTDDLALCDAGDYKEFDIKLFHWRKMMKGVKTEKPPEPVAPAPGGEESVPEEEVAPIAPQPVEKAQHVTDVRSVQFRKLKAFYGIYNPDKSGDEEGLNHILSEYQGDYDNMWRHLEQKYILGNKGVTRKKAVLDRKPNTKADAILEGIASLYRTNIRDLEAKYKFPDFHSPLMDDVDFKAKPMVLLVGQYSVGKTSFIRYMLDREFPGSRIGPEPTTDSFMAVMHGSSEKVIPGNAAVMDMQLPFKTLQRFGIQFLNKFSVSQVNSPILESITFLDTPGILSGEKQRLGRLYDFAKVVEQFAHRSDRILLLFDAHKLDISDEFRGAIEMLKGHDDKVRCILNKCDQVPNQQLLRVYGALMWSLGKVFKTPEVLRVYVGSFWDQPYSDEHNADLFDAEAQDLIADLKALPRHRVTRKINEFVKRTRQFKVHLMVVEHLRAQYGWTGKNKTTNKLLSGMGDQFRQIAEKNNLTLADFPNPNKFASIIKNHDIKAFQKLKPKYIKAIDVVLHQEVPRLMQLLPGENETQGSMGVASNPFANTELSEANLDPTKRWVVNQGQKKEFDNKFYELRLINGSASGAQVREVMMSSGLSSDTLMAIWELSDITQNGHMDSEEFALCQWLIQYVQSGNTLPAALTVNMVPPGKRHLVQSM